MPFCAQEDALSEVRAKQMVIVSSTAPAQRCPGAELAPHRIHARWAPKLGCLSFWCDWERS